MQCPIPSVVYAENSPQNCDQSCCERLATLLYTFPPSACIHKSYSGCLASKCVSVSTVVGGGTNLAVIYYATLPTCISFQSSLNSP